MPELPEVEIVRRGLKIKLPGETVKKVEIFREQSIGYPEPKKFSTLLVGKKITDVSRRAKYLLLNLQDKNTTGEAYLIVHLGMSGRLLLLDKNGATKTKFRFLRVRILLDSGRQLCFEDMRVFGRMYYASSAADLAKAIPSFAQLGIEPLEGLTAKQLQVMFQHRRQAIKSVLLNQNLIAGIGNIYADEILFQAGIHPLTASLSITAKQAKLLAQIIPATLERAIKRGGSSIKDFVDSDGVNGNYQHESLVYGRAGKPCRKCQSAIERIKIVGRSAHFCPACQKRK